MNKERAQLLLAVILIGVAVAAGMLSQRTAAQEARPAAKASGHDVIMFKCKTDGEFGISAFQGSANAPAKRSSNCPETLSLLMKDGFAIRDIGLSTDADLVVFTVVR